MTLDTLFNLIKPLFLICKMATIVIPIELFVLALIPSSIYRKASTR